MEDEMPMIKGEEALQVNRVICSILTILQALPQEEPQDHLTAPLNILVGCLARLGLVYINPEHDKDFVKQIAVGVAKNLQANR